MLDWLKNINKEYPDFWKDYLAKFEKKPSRYVMLKTDKSGTNHLKDVLYSFGAIGVVDSQVLVGDVFETVLLQYKYLHDNSLPNTFLVESRLPKMPEPQAIEALVNYIGNAVLVGYRIHHDVDLINEALEKLHCGRLRNEALDIEIMFKKYKESDKNIHLEDILKEFKISLPENATVTDEAYGIGLLFVKLKTRLGIK